MSLRSLDSVSELRSSVFVVSRGNQACCRRPFCGRIPYAPPRLPYSFAAHLDSEM